MRKVLAVKEKHESRWMATPGVVGVAIGENKGKPCITILISGPTPQTDALPASVDGVPVIVEISGPMQAQSAL
jgi:hypothetical protein